MTSILKGHEDFIVSHTRKEIRFSNIGEMLCYMDKQRTQLLKAKELIKKFLRFVNNEVAFDPEHPQEHTDLWNELCEQAGQFINEVEK